MEAHPAPCGEELLMEFFPLACEFPFLDLVIVIIGLNETEYYFGTDAYGNRMRVYYFDGWRDYADIGIYLKDGHFGMVSGEEALTLYDEYNALYGAPDVFPAKDDTYDPEHYSMDPKVL